MTKFGGGIVIGAIFGLILGIILLQQGIPPEELGKIFETGNATLIDGLILGIILSINGGFFTVKIARIEIYKNTLILGIIGLAIGLLIYPILDQYPNWYKYTCNNLGVPFTVLGGYILI